MKNTLSRKAVVLTAGMLAMMLAFAMVVAACDKDPVKPEPLATTASYDEYVAKCDEVIKYCEAKSSSAMNSGIKVGVESCKTGAAEYKDTWDSQKAGMIHTLNMYIETLE
jgi:hypothetical protein